MHSTITPGYPFCRILSNEMALPPTIPSSFVPYPKTSGSRRSSTDFSGAFAFLAYGVLAIMLAGAVGVFLYGRLLDNEKSNKDAALAKAEAALDPATVQNFFRLENRLASSKTLLAQHPAFSNLFSNLSALMPQTVRFSSIHISFDQTGTVTFVASGVAKSLNALASFSSDLAAEGHFKNAIFSGITVNQKDQSVTFGLAADIDPTLIAFSPSAVVSPTVSGTTTVPVKTSSATSSKP